MSNFQSLKTEFINVLSNSYEERECIAFFNLLLLHQKGWDRIKYVLSKDECADEETVLFFKKCVKDLIKGRPVQHIIGKVFFYNIELQVNKHVLIPRPETEELVDLIFHENKHKEALKVLDVGSGSGCIALALKESMPSSICEGVDVSKEAVELAEKNAINLGLDADFSCVDIFHFQPKISHYDILVSNPPYIPFKDKSSMDINVLEFEPDTALFVNDDNPLIFYERIAFLGVKLLKANGKIYFEIHEKFANQIVHLLEKYNYENPLIVKDLQGRDRFIAATLK